MERSKLIKENLQHAKWQIDHGFLIRGEDNMWRGAPTVFGHMKPHRQVSGEPVDGKYILGSSVMGDWFGASGMVELTRRWEAKHPSVEQPHGR